MKTLYRMIKPGVYRPIQEGEVADMAQAMAIIAALCTPAKQAEVVKTLKTIPKPPREKKGVPIHHRRFRGVGESIQRYQRQGTRS